MAFEIINGSQGDDVFTHVSGDKVYIGGDGNDSFKMAIGASGQAIFVGGGGNDTYQVLPYGLQYIRDVGGGEDSIIITDEAFYRGGLNFIIDEQISFSAYPETTPTYSERFAGVEAQPPALVVFGYIDAESDRIERVYLPTLIAPVSQNEAINFYKSAPSWGGQFAREDAGLYGIAESAITTTFLNMEQVSSLASQDEPTDDVLTETIVDERTTLVAANHSLTVVADVLGTVMLLKELNEVITETSHTIEYNGTIFNYAEVDGIVTTVIRDGEFTDEFAREIEDAYPSSAGISYDTAVALIGQANMESTLLAVAGADGNYVG